MKQYRIGIIGTENSHADSFCHLINVPDENGNLRYPDCHVTLSYGHYPESNQQMVDKYGVDKVAESLEEMVANVDAVIITARDGKFHYEFAKPFIEAGIPAFIDKPFTVDPEEAIALITLAKEKNVPLCGGSSIRYSNAIKFAKQAVEKGDQEIFGGCVTAPLHFHSEYSGFFFYASHLTESTLEIFGYNPKSVIATANNGNVFAVVNYENFSVSNDFTNSYNYGACVYTKEHIISEPLSFDQEDKLQCDDFINMLHTGKMPQTYTKLAIPVFYMNAVKEAYETGKCVNIRTEL